MINSIGPQVSTSTYHLIAPANESERVGSNVSPQEIKEAEAAIEELNFLLIPSVYVNLSERSFGPWFNREVPHLDWYEKNKRFITREILESLSLDVCFDFAGILASYMFLDKIIECDLLASLLPFPAKLLYDNLKDINYNIFLVEIYSNEVKKWKEFSDRYRTSPHRPMALAALINNKRVDIRELIYHEIISFEDLELIGPHIKKIRLNFSLKTYGNFPPAFAQSFAENSYIKEFIKGFKNIISLELSGIQANYIENFTTLEWQNLRELRLYDYPSALPENLLNLKTLSCIKCPKLDGVALKNLSELKNLYWQDFTHPPFFQGARPTLEKLCLHGVSNFTVTAELPRSKIWEFHECENLERISEEGMFCEELRIVGCAKITHLPENTFLKRIEIRYFLQKIEDIKLTDVEIINFLSKNISIENLFIAVEISDKEFENLCVVALNHPRLNSLSLDFTNDQCSRLIEKTIKSENRVLEEIFTNKNYLKTREYPLKNSDKLKLLSERKESHLMNKRKIAYALSTQFSLANGSPGLNYTTRDHLLHRVYYAAERKINYIAGDETKTLKRKREEEPSGIEF